MLGARRDQTLRAWVPDCGTGEEVFSLVLRLVELGDVRDHGGIQVFGSDADARAVSVARTGRYPHGSIEHRFPGDSRRYLEYGQDDVRVAGVLRQRALFMVLDLLSGPFLGRIDLIWARHLPAQHLAKSLVHLMSSFHFSLRGEGCLIVGSDVACSVPAKLFEPLDRDWGIFRVRRAAGSRAAASALPTARAGGPSGLAAAGSELADSTDPRRRELDKLERALADSKNFVAAIGIPALICDARLRITRVSPAVAELLTARVKKGALLEDVVERLPGGHQLLELAATVREAGVAQQLTWSARGRTHLVRLHPYRDPRAAMRGVVIVFSDVSELEAARALAAKREHQQAAVAELGSLATNAELRTGPRIAELLPKALQVIKSVLGWRHGFVLECGRESEGRSELCSSWSAAGLAVQLELPVVEGSSLAVALASEQVVCFGSPPADAAIERLTGGSRVSSVAMCALRGGEGSVGLLLLADEAQRTLDADGRHFVHAATNVLAGALARARTARRLALERAIGLAVAEATDRRDMLERIVAALREVLTLETLDVWTSEGSVRRDPLVQVWPAAAASRGVDLNPTAARAFSESRPCWRSARGSGRELAFPILLGHYAIGVVRGTSREVLSVESELLAGFERAGRAIGDFIHWSRLDEALRSSERRYRQKAAELEAVYASLPAGAATYDRNLRPLLSNERSHELGAPALSRDAAPIIREVFRNGAVIRDVELSTRTDLGMRFWLCSFAPVHDSEGEVVSVSSVVQDVTDQKRLERALRDADRQKDEFLAMLGHELRTPLAAIRHAADLLRLTREEHCSLQTRIGAVLERQTSRMGKLIDGLLDVSRIIHGKLELERSSLDLCRLLGNVVDDRLEQLDERGVSVDLELPAERIWVHADPIRLTQVFDNLLSNAIKYSHDGGQIRVRLKTDASCAYVQVEDQGIGIDPELLPHIFAPFRQATHRPGRSLGGLGLGLSLVKGLVDLHGGKVTAASRGEGYGSLFTVQLELTDEQGTPSSLPPASGVNLRVLIVDDNRDMAETLSELLSFTGHDVVGVERDGGAAIEAARRLRPDLVLSDLELAGGVDGFEVARALRSDPALAGLQLILLTGYGGTDYRKRARASGFDACLTKPVTVEVLQNELARIAKRRNDRHA